VVNGVERGQVGEKLPKGWKWVKLGEICEINPTRPRGLSRDDDSQTTFVPMPSVDARLGKITSPEIRPFSEVRKGYTYFEENDVLFAKISPCMENGKHSIASDLIDSFGFGTTEFHVLRAGSLVIPGWIHKFLRQPKISEEAVEHFSGSVGQQRVPAEYLSNLEILLPPLPEQKRIVGILSDRLTAIDKARAAIEAQLKAAKALPAAYFRQVFDSPEAQKWKRKKLGDVCDISTGTTPATNQSHYYEGATPFVRTSEIINNVITQTETNITQQAINDYSLKLYPSGTVLMAMYGQGKTRGQVAILEIPATTTQNAAAMVPCADLSSEYLWYWLRGQYEYLRKLGYQGDISHLSLKYVKQLEIPWVPIGNQKKIVLSLDDRMTAVNKLQRSLQSQLTTISQLPAATLRQAFNGEL